MQICSQIRAKISLGSMLVLATTTLVFARLSNDAVGGTNQIAKDLLVITIMILTKVTQKVKAFILFGLSGRNLNSLTIYHNKKFQTTASN